MTKDFLEGLKVGNSALPAEIIDAILEESRREQAAANTNAGGTAAHGGRTFSQEDVNRIVSERLSRERERAAQQTTPDAEARERALAAREARLSCREYLDAKRYPAALLEALDTADVEKFKGTVDKLMEPGALFTMTGASTATPPAGGAPAPDFAAAFKPPKI